MHQLAHCSIRRSVREMSDIAGEEAGPAEMGEDQRTGLGRKLSFGQRARHAEPEDRDRFLDRVGELLLDRLEQLCAGLRLAGELVEKPRNLVALCLLESRTADARLQFAEALEAGQRGHFRREE